MFENKCRGLKRPQTFLKKVLDKQPKVWYNDYRKKRGEQNVQNCKWCGCPVRGAVCVRNDYGKYVKKGKYINGQEN